MLRNLPGFIKRSLLRLRPLPLERSEGHLGGYALGKPDPATHCTEIWDLFINEFEIQSVLDVGCGLGYGLEHFAARGCAVLGIDGSPSAVRDNRMPEHVVLHDYTRGPYIPDRKYDLIWTSEFVEHVEERFVDHFLATFRQAGCFLLMSYAAPGQYGHHHVNLQPAKYWIRKMQSIGLNYDPGLTRRTRSLTPDTAYRCRHFSQRGLVFRTG